MEQESFGSLYNLCIDNVPFAKLDFCEGYEQVVPFKRHRVVKKQTGKTNYIERREFGVRNYHFLNGINNREFNRLSTYELKNF